MSINLLSHVSDKVTDATISKLGSILGIDNEIAQAATHAALPTLLKAIISRGDTSDNARALRNFIRTNNLASNVATDFINLDRESTKDYLKIGGKSTDFLFGGAKESLVGNIIKKSGLSAELGSKLTDLLAPLALGHVSKLGNRENYTDVQLASYLKSQKDNLTDSGQKKTSEKTRKTTEEKSFERTISTGGLLKWLVPLLGLAAVLWWFGQKAYSAPESSSPTTKTEVKTPEKTKTNTPANKATNPLEKPADVEIKKTSNATPIESTSSTNSVSSNATDDFNTIFTKMFSNKAMVGTTYALSQIVFDKESHKITDFSKSEVESLASVLKTMPGAKIQVQVHSKDGDDKTKLRAQVVKDMLVTLGVDKGQISSKGMGEADATKAAGDKVEIKVESIK